MNGRCLRSSRPLARQPVSLQVLLFRHHGGESIAKWFVGVETRIEGFVRLAEDANQQHHLPVLHFPDSHFDFRHFTATDVPPGYLEPPRQIRLRPVAIAPDAPDLPTDHVLMHHAAGKGSNTAPARRAAVRMRLMAGGCFAMFSRTKIRSLVADYREVRWGTVVLAMATGAARPSRTRAGSSCGGCEELRRKVGAVIQFRRKQPVNSGVPSHATTACSQTRLAAPVLPRSL